MYQYQAEFYRRRTKLDVNSYTFVYIPIAAPIPVYHIHVDVHACRHAMLSVLANYEEPCSSIAVYMYDEYRSRSLPVGAPPTAIAFIIPVVQTV